jgi:hypothetical protein
VRTASTSLLLAGAALLLACSHSPDAGAAPSPLQASASRANQAPIVGLPDVLANDTLLGRRVRVLGWCAGAPGLLVGRRLGAWYLGTPDTIVEIRGLVPKECGPSEAQQALILLFAQVVRAFPDSGERLLLRLPD